MRENRMLRSTRRELETWFGRELTIPARRPRAYLCGGRSVMGVPYRARNRVCRRSQTSFSSLSR